MGVASSVALGVAERVERTAGPRAGLRAWKTLAESSSDAETRGKAILAALRCSLVLGSLEEIDNLVALWGTVEGGAWDESITSLCDALASKKLGARARDLARVDARRDGTARSLYRHARCLELARNNDTDVSAAFGHVVLRARKEGAMDIERVAHVRRAAILSRSWHTMDQALEEARVVDVAALPVSSRLIVARILLRSPSRFTRAGALSVLDEIVQREPTELVRRALLLAARWVDDAGDALTALEGDRLVALFDREPARIIAPGAFDVVRSLAQIAGTHISDAFAVAIERGARNEAHLAAVHARTRDILGGRFEVLHDSPGAPPADPSDRRAHRFGEILDVVVALRDELPARAARSLRPLAAAEEEGEHLPREVLDVAQAAFAHGDPELREVSGRLIGARLRSPSRAIPARGFRLLAETLRVGGSADLADTARRAAVVLKESGAAASLGTALVRSGWELARAGDREGAIEKLREAKALLADG